MTNVLKDLSLGHSASPPMLPEMKISQAHRSAHPSLKCSCYYQKCLPFFPKQNEVFFTWQPYKYKPLRYSHTAQHMIFSKVLFKTWSPNSVWYPRRGSSALRTETFLSLQALPCPPVLGWQGDYVYISTDLIKISHSS